VGSGENVDGTRAHKDLTDQYAEQLCEDVKYRRKWCEKIGVGFVLPTNATEARSDQESSMKLLNLWCAA
jgi:hypothetical protein